jgi:hypothetical protein
MQRCLMQETVLAQLAGRSYDVVMPADSSAPAAFVVLELPGAAKGPLGFAVVLLGALCVAVLMAQPLRGFLGLLAAATAFPIGYFTGNAFGAQRLTSGLIGGVVAEGVFLLCCLLVSGFAAARAEREIALERAVLEEWKERPRTDAEMDEYFRRRD